MLIPIHCQGDVNLTGYRKHLIAQDAPAPLTMAEEELEEIKRSEVTLYRPNNGLYLPPFAEEVWLWLHKTSTL